MPKRSGDLPEASWLLRGRGGTQGGFPAPNPMLLSWHHSCSPRGISVPTAQWGEHTSQRGCAILGGSAGPTWSCWTPSSLSEQPGRAISLSQYPRPAPGSSAIEGRRRGADLLSLDPLEHREMKSIIYIIYTQECFVNQSAVQMPCYHQIGFWFPTKCK